MFEAGADLDASAPDRVVKPRRDCHIFRSLGLRLCGRVVRYWAVPRRASATPSHDVAAHWAAAPGSPTSSTANKPSSMPSPTSHKDRIQATTPPPGLTLTANTPGQITGCGDWFRRLDDPLDIYAARRARFM